jgi:hypothetical protein
MDNKKEQTIAILKSMAKPQRNYVK